MGYYIIYIFRNPFFRIYYIIILPAQYSVCMKVLLLCILYSKDNWVLYALYYCSVVTRINGDDGDDQTYIACIGCSNVYRFYLFILYFLQKCYRV